MPAKASRAAFGEALVDLGAKDDRIVYVFAGAPGFFAEAPDSGGLSYELESAPGGGPPSAPIWNGHYIPPCGTTPVAPCAALEDDRMTAYLIGPGVLEVLRPEGGARVTIDGGRADRKLTVIVRT